MQPEPDREEWATAAGGDTLLHLHVRPGAKRSAIAGVHGARLKVAVKAPPVDGKANAALVEFLADLLRLPRRQVVLESGAAHRDKTVRVVATARVGVAAAIRAAMSRPDR